MSHLSRRQLLKLGGAGVGAVLLSAAWTARSRPASAVHAAPAEVRAAKDLALWYDEGAGDDWLRALPIGNGRLGAMVYGNLHTERLQLNEDTVWAGGPYAANNPRGAEELPEIQRLVFADEWEDAQDLIKEAMLGKPVRQMAYQPVGDLKFVFPHGPVASEFYRHLDLTTATASVNHVIDGVRYRREMFASAPDQVIAVRLTADTPGSITFSVKFDSPQETTVSSPDSVTIALDGVSGDYQGVSGSVKFLALARAIVSGGSVTSKDGTLEVKSADSVTLLVSIGSSYVNYKDAGGDYQAIAWGHLSAAEVTKYDDMRGRHVADYLKLFGRTTIDLGRTEAADQPTDVRIVHHSRWDDPQFSTLLFQFGRYLLISSSRPGTQPANLQGIWNDKMAPPWESKYTINVNLPMNYWPADITNLSECFLPVFDMIKDLTVTGARTAEVLYGAGGWVTHHNTDAWRGTSVVDSAFSGMWQTGSAWLATMIWDHYLFTGDIDFLRSNYPAMKGAAEFFLDTLVPEPKLKWLVTNPSNSPELAHHKGVSVCAGPTMDNQLLRDLFDGVARASEVIGVDATFRDKILAAKDKLPPMQIGSRGNIQEWLYDWTETEPRHRHVAQLYGLHPSNQITRRGTPKLYDAARKTLDLRGDDGTGWSLACKINFWARMEDASRSHKLLSQLVSSARLAPNMFDLHPPFQIDGNFGATSGIAEMLLHSHTGELHVLPALPPAWPRGRVAGLRGRGAVTVGAAWSEGQADELLITPDRSGKVKVRSQMFTGRYKVVDTTLKKAVGPTKLESDLIELPGQSKSTYRVYALQKVRLQAPIEVIPGQTVKGKVAVRAIELDLTKSTTVSLVAPDGWTVSPTSVTLQPINANTERTAEFDVTVGAKTPLGTATLAAKAAGSDWTASATVSTRVWNGRVVNLSDSFTNVGTSDDTETDAGNFDGNGASISAQALAKVAVTPGSTISRGGVDFTWPKVPVGDPDNAVASGQAVKVTGAGKTLGFLVASTYGAVSRPITVVYADGTRQSFIVDVPDWNGAPKPGGDGAIVVPYQNRPGEKRQESPATIYFIGVPLQNKALARVDLPNVSSRAAAKVSTVHVFAIAVGD